MTYHARIESHKDAHSQATQRAGRMGYSALIVDDERADRASIRSTLARHPGWSLAGEASSLDEASVALDLQPVDLVFLDIQMPEGDGLALARQLSAGRRLPALILTSANNQHAVDAFETRAVGYLLKPLSEERVARALERAREQIDLVRVKELHFPSEPSMDDCDPEWFCVKSVRKIERVPVAEIRWIESCGNYVILHAEDREIMHRTTMSRVESSLSTTDWQRVHRKLVVRRSEIVALHSTGPHAWELEITGGRRLPIGPTYLEQVRAAFK